MTQAQKNQLTRAMNAELNSLMTKALFARQDGDDDGVDYWEAEVRAQIDEMKALGIDP